MYTENTYSTVSHSKALHNYLIPWLNLRKTCRNLLKSSKISGNFRKLRKHFKPVLEELLKMIYENFGKSLVIFGNFWKTSETFQNSLKIFGKSLGVFGNGSKVFFRCFYDFLKFSENLRKTSEMVQKCFKCFYDFLKFSENLRKLRKCFESVSDVL